MSTVLAKRPTPVKVRRHNIAIERMTEVRRVNYFTHEQDFQCPLLAAIGISTVAIAELTHLTVGQVMYRITKYEDAIRNKKKGEKTSRTKYRQGKGEIAQALIQTVTGTRSPVKGVIIQKMEAKDLYAPIRGVLRG